MTELLTSNGFWIVIFGGLYALTHIAAWTPNKTDDKIVSVLRKGLDIVAGNYGIARNAAAKVEGATTILESKP